jgi:GAF domain-containing protein
MAEQLHIPETASRAQRYRALLPQLQALFAGETDPVANMANCCAALRQTFGFFWVGFYLVKGDGPFSSQELVLGPFQGDIACTRIAYGRGVCGAAWQRGQTILVPDVDAFPGHIACSSLSRSEIVVPLFRGDGVIAVLDVDSDRLNDFSDEDRLGLEAIAHLIAPLL